ncbi:hypothetical protein M3G91_24980 [Micromonospora chalcea]|uniref:hypothetical protein n=1 Tax=Micromonospora chalcea TaxID=1874 RepID=UPI0021A74DF8|nr:hypothetical protein [Micromonospora chalcea]MCT2280874.1 hypothetical protein [Micromonospora chalcea]
MPHQPPAPIGRLITEGQLYLLAAAVALTAAGVLWATGYEHSIATALLVVTAAVGVLGWRGCVSDEARRREMRALRAEVLHYGGVIEMMARDMESADVRNERAIERAREHGAAEAMAEAQAERQQLVEQHRAEVDEVRRAAEARGYVAGARQRLGDSRSLRLRLVRPDGQRERVHPY